MPFDEHLSARLRTALHGVSAVTEKKMFGGIAFMVDGHMCCGVEKDDLMVRVGPDAYDECLALPGVREMDFTGRPLRGFVYVSQDVILTEDALQEWVARGLSFVRSLPPK